MKCSSGLLVFYYLNHFSSFPEMNFSSFFSRFRPKVELLWLVDIWLISFHCIKVSLFGVILVHIFPAFSRIRTVYGADTFYVVFLTVIIETILAKLCLGCLLYAQYFKICRALRFSYWKYSASFAKRLILNITIVSWILLNWLFKMKTFGWNVKQDFSYIENTLPSKNEFALVIMMSWSCLPH